MHCMYMLKALVVFLWQRKYTKETVLFDNEENGILEALENNQMVRSINAEEEIAFARKAAKEYLTK